MAEDRVPFSQRYNTRQRPPGGLLYETITAPVVIGVGNSCIAMTEEVRANGTPIFALDAIIERICLEGDRKTPNIHNHTVLFNILDDLAWDELFNVCEGLYEWFEGLPSRGVTFERNLNRVSSRNFLGYEMRQGAIERVGALTQEEAIKEARGILADSDLAGPNEQFEDALRLYNARPNPDLDNAIKEAVSAIEGLARILLNDRTVMLSRAMDRMRQDKGVHPALADIVVKLYGYRGDREGVSHGATARSSLTLPEAEFVIGVSANAIVYLARLYGRGVA